MQTTACVFIVLLNAPFLAEHCAEDNDRYEIKAPSGIIWLRGSTSQGHTYYYLCKHVILLSNEPFTGSVMKQLALTQTK